MKVKKAGKQLNDKGMSLVGVVVSITILSVVIVVVLQSLTTAMVYDSKARKRQDTTFKAESVMEVFKGNSVGEIQVSITADPVIDANFVVGGWKYMDYDHKAGDNVAQKSTVSNKQSFYMAEQTLDKLKELLVAEVNEAYEYAYRDMMRNYLSLGTDDARLRYYADQFTVYLKKKWEKERETVGGAGKELDTVQKFMRGAKDEDGNRRVGDDMVKLVTGVRNDGFQIRSIENKNRFVIEGIQIYYVDENGFSAYINTDIALTPSDYKASGSGTFEEPELVNIAENVIYINWKKN